MTRKLWDVRGCQLDECQIPRNSTGAEGDRTLELSSRVARPKRPSVGWRLDRGPSQNLALAASVPLVAAPRGPDGGARVGRRRLLHSRTVPRHDADPGPS